MRMKRREKRRGKRNGDHQVKFKFKGEFEPSLFTSYQFSYSTFQNFDLHHIIIGLNDYLLFLRLIFIIFF